MNEPRLKTMIRAIARTGGMTRQSATLRYFKHHFRTGGPRMRGGASHKAGHDNEFLTMRSLPEIQAAMLRDREYQRDGQEQRLGGVSGTGSGEGDDGLHEEPDGPY